MLQPFQVSPQVPTPFNKQQQLQAAHQQATTPIQARNQVKIPATLSDQSKHRGSPNPLSIKTLLDALSNPSLGTPSVSPSGKRRSVGTVWKNTPPTQTPAPSSPTRPRSVSPIDEPTPVTVKRGRGQKQSAPSTRSGRLTSRKTRGASVNSSLVASSVRGHSRSPSLVSHASGDGSASKTVKSENPMTPMDTSELLLDDTPMPAPPRRAHSTRSKRKRSLAPSEASEVARGTTADVAEQEDELQGTIIAVRNFPRLSNPVMGDITGHKYASMFTNRISDKNVEGYSSIIRRPTDIKTIKAAITAGAKAVGAYESSASSSRDASALVLPWSKDLVPPKAIVNSAQLEKELMRMFANAVMFNPGEEDVVADSREMFDDAVVHLVRFRDAEKGAEMAARKKEEGDDDDNNGSATPVTAGKRRKLG